MTRDDERKFLSLSHENSKNLFLSLGFVPAYDHSLVTPRPMAVQQSVMTLTTVKEKSWQRYPALSMTAIS